MLRINSNLLSPLHRQELLILASHVTLITGADEAI